MELPIIVPLVTFVEQHVLQALTELGRLGVEDFGVELASRALAVLGGVVSAEEEGALSLQISQPREKLGDEEADVGVLGLALQDLVDLVVHPVDQAGFRFLDGRRQFGHHRTRVHLAWQELRRFRRRYDREAREVIHCTIYLTLVSMHEDEVESLS